MTPIDFATVVSTLAEESHPGRAVGAVLAQLLVIGGVLYLVVWAAIKLFKKPPRPGPGGPPAYWQGQAPPPGAPWPPHQYPPPGYWAGPPMPGQYPYGPPYGAPVQQPGPPPPYPPPPGPPTPQ